MRQLLASRNLSKVISHQKGFAQNFGTILRALVTWVETEFEHWDPACLLANLETSTLSVSTMNAILQCKASLDNLDHLIRLVS